MKALLLVAALALLPASPANAALPGDDGEIAFTSLCCETANDPPDETLMRALPGGGSEPARITTGSEPAWSPDGRRLAFADRGVWTARPTGEGRRLLAESASWPSWSPGGRWIVAVDANATLVLLRADGSRRRTLDSSDFPVSEPSWGARGLIAYTVTGARGGRLLGIVKASGGRGRVIIDGANPDWSPSGRRLVFERQGGIYVSNGRGRRARIVAAHGSDPVWSPSGKSIAYVNRRGDVVAVGSDGHGRRTVVEAPESRVEDPAWQPLG